MFSDFKGLTSFRGSRREEGFGVGPRSRGLGGFGVVGVPGELSLKSHLDAKPYPTCPRLYKGLGYAANPYKRLNR